MLRSGLPSQWVQNVYTVISLPSMVTAAVDGPKSTVPHRRVLEGING